MLCEHAETLLALFALDELEPGPKAELQAHLEECVGCRENLENIRATLGLLRQAAARQPVPRLSDQRRTALLKRVAEEEKVGASARPGFHLVRRIGVRIKKSFKENPRFVLARIAAGIAILLILGGLILPALSRAREDARRTACASNLGQIVKASASYSADYKGYMPRFLPPAAETSPAPDLTGRTKLLYPNAADGEKIFAAPSESTTRELWMDRRDFKERIAGSFGSESDSPWVSDLNSLSRGREEGLGGGDAIVSDRFSASVNSETNVQIPSEAEITRAMEMFWIQKEVADRLSTLESAPKEAGENVLYADGHVIWHDFDVASGETEDKPYSTEGENVWHANADSYVSRTVDDKVVAGGPSGGALVNGPAAYRDLIPQDKPQSLPVDGGAQWESYNLASNEAIDKIDSSGVSWGADYRMWDGTNETGDAAESVKIDPNSFGVSSQMVDVNTGTAAFSSSRENAPQAEAERLSSQTEGSAPVLAHIPILKRLRVAHNDRDSVTTMPAPENLEITIESEKKGQEVDKIARAKLLLKVLDEQKSAFEQDRAALDSVDNLRISKEALAERRILEERKTLDVLQSANDDFANGKYENAIQTAQSVLEQQPNNPAAKDIVEQSERALRRRSWTSIAETDKRNRENESVRVGARLIWPGSTIEFPSKDVWEAITNRERGGQASVSKSAGQKAAGGEKEEQMYVVLTPEETARIDRRPMERVSEKSSDYSDYIAMTKPEPDSQAVPQMKSEDDLPAPIFKAGPVNPWVMAAKDALSTFGIDVDTAAYAIARGYIRRGYLPPPASVRMEEFVNAFDYNYSCNDDRVFTTHVEGAPSPFGSGLTLLKIGIRGKVIGRDGRKPAHLVFVVDASGSMARQDRIPLVQYALKQLVSALNPNDTVSLVLYNTRATLAMEAVPVARKDEIIRAIDAIRCGGSTNLYDGLKLGYGVAARGFRTGGVNRVILCSDGIANVGSDDADEMLENVEAFRKQGIAFTAAGIGSGAYNDVLMERLADRGDGNYVFVDSEAEARRVFVENMAATLQTIAKDVKIQVAFDPARVRRYRLIGFENRDIADADFRNDTVDAGEIGSGQSATALYEVELLPPPQISDGPVTDLGTVYVRYRDLETDKVEEIAHRIDNDSVYSRTVAESPRFYLAACAAEFAEILRESEHATDGNLDKVGNLMGQVATQLPLDKQVQELFWMVRTAKGLPKASAQSHSVF